MYSQQFLQSKRSHIPPESPEYEPTIPVKLSPILMLKINNMKNKIPTENNKAKAPREIINSLSSLLFIYKYLRFLTVYSLKYCRVLIYGLYFDTSLICLYLIVINQ